VNHRPLFIVRPQLEQTLIIRRFRNEISTTAGTANAITRKSPLIKKTKIAKSASEPMIKM
jgi:hypothetical protein